MPPAIPATPTAATLPFHYAFTTTWRTDLASQAVNLVVNRAVAAADATSTMLQLDPVPGGAPLGHTASVGGSFTGPAAEAQTAVSELDAFANMLSAQLPSYDPPPVTIRQVRRTG